MLEAFEKAADAFTRMGAGKGWNITISHGGNMRDAVLRNGFRLFSVENNGGSGCFYPAHVRAKTNLKMTSL